MISLILICQFHYILRPFPEQRTLFIIELAKDIKKFHFLTFPIFYYFPAYSDIFQHFQTFKLHYERFYNI